MSASIRRSFDSAGPRVHSGSGTDPRGCSPGQTSPPPHPALVAHPVFISYARATSRDDAETLHQALGGAEGQAFLDRTDFEAGEAIPSGLVDA